MTFKPNRKFKREYDKLFKQDLLGANVFLLLAELADEKGRIKIQGSNEKEVAQEFSSLMEVRFTDPTEYAL